MRENFSVSIKGEKVTLVPYRKKFVNVYHDWMKDPYILEMTASEPLELSEEFEMQNSWQEDANKCTFILLATNSMKTTDDTIRHTDEEIASMVGDVNLFLNDRDDPRNAEIEVMIAESAYRRKGYAQEAVELMMAYGVEHLKLHRFYAKINQTNQTSRNLFLRLGFKEVNYVAAFEEYEYEFRVADSDSAGLELTSTGEGSKSEIHGISEVLKRAAHAVHVEYTEPE